MTSNELKNKVIEFNELLKKLSKVSQALTDLIETSPHSDEELIIYDRPKNPHATEYKLYLYPSINDDSVDTKNKVTAFCKDIECVLTKPEVVRIVKLVGGSIKTMTREQLVDLGVAFQKACETLPHVGIDFKKSP